MTNDAVAKMTADYIWKNRDNGWVKNAALVQEAVPQICRIWARALHDELVPLEGCEVEARISDGFEVVITKSKWGSRQLAFGCDGGWSVGSTWFGVKDTEGLTDKEAQEYLRKALDGARSDRGSSVESERDYPAYFYTQTFFDTPDMVRAIAKEAKRLTRKLDKALRDDRRRSKDDES